jgi:hypothetical protein
MCHYPAVFLNEIPSHTAPVSAPVSAHRHLLGRIAVASLLHRRRIAVASPPHRVAGELPTSLELHLPVVHPTRCTRTEEVEPQQWALGEAMTRTHVEVKGCDAMIQQKL